MVAPGFRSAAMIDYYERLVPPGDEPHEIRAARALGEIVREQRLDQESPYAAMAGDRVFLHVLEFAFKSLRRPELAKAVGAELESVLPIDLEDMVYAFEQLPRDVGRRTAPDLAVLEEGVDPSFAAQPVAPFLAAGPLAPPPTACGAVVCRPHRAGARPASISWRRAVEPAACSRRRPAIRADRRIAPAAAAAARRCRTIGTVAVVDIGTSAPTCAWWQRPRIYRAPSRAAGAS